MKVLMYISTFLFLLTFYNTIASFFLSHWHFRMRLRKVGVKKSKKRTKKLKEGNTKPLVKFNKSYKSIEQSLSTYNIQLTPKEFVTIHVCLTIAVFLSANHFLNDFFSLLISLVCLSFPYLVFRYLGKRRKEHLLAQLPDALEIISTSLKSGFSLYQTFEILANENLDPISIEFQTMLHEMHYGKSLEDALEQFAHRTDLYEIQTFVDTIIIAKQTGGTMTSVFDELVEQMRENDQIRKEVKALTSQGKLSAFIIGSLPFGLFLILLLINPLYIQSLFDHILGIVFIVLALVLQSIGIFVMSRIIKLKLR